MTTAPFPALLHARKLIAKMLAQNPHSGPAYHHVILHGGHTRSRDDTDREMPFRQESNFFWVSGCEIPSSALVISYPHLGVGREFDGGLVEATLFLPREEKDEVRLPHFLWIAAG